MKKFIVLLIISLVCCGVVYCAAVGNIAKHIIFKGLNTTSGPLSLDDGESPDCMNVHTNLFGTLKKRSGSTVLNSTTVHASATANGIYEYTVNSTTKKLVANFETSFWKMDDLDGTWDQITFATTFSDNPVEYANFDGTLVMTTWGRDVAQTWDGSAASTSNLAALPLGKYLVQAYNRLFVSDCSVGGTVYPLRFYYSTAGTSSTWPSDNYETLDAPAGDVAMGWGLLKGRLFGFTKYTVNLISDVGGAYPIQVTRRVDGTGCGAPKTIKTVNIAGMGESLVWLTSDRRLVAYDGSSLADISKNIYVNNSQSPFCMTNINSANLTKAHAVVYEKEGWYVLFVPISSSVDYSLIFDYKTMTLWPNNNQGYGASTIAYNSTAGNSVYVLDTNGKGYRWYYGNSDNGTAINGYWTSRKWDWGNVALLKKMGEAQISTKTIGNYNLAYQYRYNWDTAWSTAENLTMYDSEWLLGDDLPATLGGKLGKVHRKTIDGAYNLFQIKLTNNTSNPPFEVYSVDVVTQTTGVVSD